MTNGNIGIFDTKSGLTAKTATAKAEALTEYTRKYSNITGGIVVSHKGEWLVHRGSTYHYNGDSFEGWDTVEDVLSKPIIIYH